MTGPVPPPPEDPQRTTLVDALHHAHLTHDEVWLRYFSLGGTAGPQDVAAYLEGRSGLDAVQRDRLALAVNERLDDLSGDRRVGYVRPVREVPPETGALAALTDLLRGTHLRPPEALQAAVDAAARSLGVRATAYLVDLAGSTLVPVGGPERGPRLDVDATVAGLAFRRLAAEVSTDGEPRLWVPIIDGVQRLGVLDVVPDVATDVDDPALRHECWHFAHYLGHVIGAVDRYGDALAAVRRRGASTMAADLVSALLPPLSAGTDKVVVCGRVEPSVRMGGDAFDYALSADTAQLAIFDGTGRDLHAGVIAAVALAAYRGARREGRGLFGQVQAVHDTLTDEFGAGPHATGILAQLDLHTGGLRYISAGHPSPVVMRRGRPVRTLREGRRALLGVDARSVVVGQEQLEPEDLLVLYTDGITEARDAADRPFGVDGLTDLLAREHAATTPLPEVTRRVGKAVLRRQAGALQDDATLVLAHWTTEGQANLDPGDR